MIVYAALRGAPDYSAPPPVLIGIFDTEEAAARKLTERYTLEQIKDSAELQAYFVIRAYDTTTGKTV